MTRDRTLAALLILLFLCAPFAQSASKMPDPMLPTTSFQSLIQSFNDADAEQIATDIPDHDALAWLTANAPRFECPDATLTRTWWFRWWCYRKHLKHTPDGWIVTEFLPDVPWAGKDNSISCAAGHHLYEGRWLRDPQYAADYARFWFRGSGEPRRYSFWAADSVRAVCLATGDNTLALNLLPDLVLNYEAWERDKQDATGLYQQSDDRDGMEYSLGGSGYRPTINSYQYGDALAIAAIAEQAENPALAREYQDKATRLKDLVQQHLWDKDAQFFETARATPNSSALKTVGVREQIGFVPWAFLLPDNGHEAAWKQLQDPQGFAAPFGPTTVERRAPGFMHAEPHDCLWNGPSWPYATTQTLVALANLLNDYKQSVVGKADYLGLLQIFARSQQKDGKPWVAEDLDADTGKWIVDLPRSVFYNHSGFADPIVTGLIGLRPRADNRIVINPLAPDGAWDWFCLDEVPYHGHTLSIFWDRTGKRYHRGAGLQVLCDGRALAHRPELGRLEAAQPMQTPQSAPKKPAAWVKHAGNPVLGGDLGTCFDLCVLRDGGKYRTWFSWRPKKSIAVTDSLDGVHWSEPKIVLGPTATGWEDDINRPCVVKRADGYHLWYTGQANGHSQIGYAASADGLHWTRKPKPVLSAEQPWEKVAVMCPDVLWDEATKQYRLWYSGGDQYEPDAIGYATSPDGISWSRLTAPVFAADAHSAWEQHKVTACQIVQRDGWYEMFYVGFRDIDHAAIGVARSRDGLTNWQRLPANPIVSPTPGAWDADACYKPFALYDGHTWRLWYNGRQGNSEQIGLVTKEGPDLGF